MFGSERSDQIEPSATLSITALANELQKQGKDIVGFGAGEPDFPTPAPIKQAGVEAIENNYTRYTAASGAPELKEAIQAKLRQDQDVEYSPDQITTGCGAKHVLFNIMASVVNPGDEVMLFSPYWVSYPNQIRFFGGEPVVVDTSDTSFLPEPDRIRDAITDRTRILLLNSPSNPTGAVVPRERVEQIAELCLENDILLLSDEIYEKLIYDGREHFSPVEISEEMKRQTVLVNGVSKAYAMTGWRLGYAAGPEDVIGRINKLMSHSTSNPCSITQKAGIQALQTPDSDIAGMINTFAERRDLMVERILEIPGMSCEKPGGAFYVFPDVSSWIESDPDLDSDMDLAEQLIEEAHVALVPGTPFGSPGFVRLSYATSTERILAGLDRLEKWARNR